ncbi:MAG: hypothetical protein GY771_14045 [bacterium]|nr:hypothetical protein [bacterium]
MKRLKYLPWLIPVVLAIAVILWLVFGGYDAIRDYFENEPSGVTTLNPPPPADVGIPEDAEPVPVVEDRYTISERLSPFYEPTRAEELTKDLPPGTEVYEVGIPGREPGLIYRTPQGYVYELGDLDVTAYRTPEPFIAAEFRPKVIATTDFSSVGVGFELDLLRIWSVNIGPAVGGNFNKTFWLGAGAGYNVWKNVDIGGYGGKALGNRKYSYGIDIGITII